MVSQAGFHQITKYVSQRDSRQILVVAGFDDLTETFRVKLRYGDSETDRIFLSMESVLWHENAMRDDARESLDKLIQSLK